MQFCCRCWTRVGDYKNLNTVKVFWKYLLNGDGYYFGWDEIIFSKQAARPFMYLDANHEMQSLKWRIGSKIRLKWTVPWFSVFVDQTNLKIIWKFSLSQYRCHKPPINVENCIKSALNSNHRKQNFTASLPQNRFRWRWLLFQECWTPSLF